MPASGECPSDRAFGLYVHWPYCESKCPYCDFNSHVVRQIDVKAWQLAYSSELHRLRCELGPRRLTSIYFGGGTPSLMTPSLVGSVIDTAAKLFGICSTAEITLEANPTSYEAKKFSDFQSEGVNRVSIGIQSLDNHDLARLGRRHSADDAVAAVNHARSIFPRVTFDLMYGRQDQSVASWEAELRRALSMTDGHISLYQLTIEPGTIFGRRHAEGKLPGLPDEDRSVEFFQVTKELCEEKGLWRYEVSNYASPGEESRHNLTYWRGEDYMGIGPGAHGRLTINGQRIATEGHLDPRDWLSHATSGNGDSIRNVLAPEEIALEYVLMGLRTTEGISLPRWLQLSGRPAPPKTIETFADLGLLEVVNGYLRATDAGFMILNRLIESLVSE